MYFRAFGTDADGVRIVNRADVRKTGGRRNCCRHDSVLRVIRCSYGMVLGSSSKAVRTAAPTK